MRKDFYYTSRDGVTKIHGMEWKPEGQVRAVLQICHGMVEYIERYDEFARFLSDRGYCVVGHDHLGHGKSIQSQDDYGFFHEAKGNQYVIGDIHKLREMAMKKYPDVPYFMMGHSMGSFLVRQYLTMYGKGLSGAIIMGTGHKGALILAAGKSVCRLIACFKGWKHRSTLVNNLGMGGYNKQFEPSNSTKDWITSDDDMRKAYEADPLCSFTFTVSGYYQMFIGMQKLTKAENLKKMPKDLPVYFVAGEDDPVGECGKAVRKVYQQFRDCGMKDVSMKLYKGDRHEILNETDRDQVYEDIWKWMETYDQRVEVFGSEGCVRNENDVPNTVVLSDAVVNDKETPVSGSHEPGTGEINYKKVLRHLEESGYQDGKGAGIKRKSFSFLQGVREGLFTVHGDGDVNSMSIG